MDQLLNKFGFQFTEFLFKKRMTKLLLGEVVTNKHAAWKGLWLTAFINVHKAFFFKHLMESDKMRYAPQYAITQH